MAMAFLSAAKETGGWLKKNGFEILGWTAIGCAVAGVAVLTAGVAVAIGAGFVGTVAGLSGAGATAATAAAVSSVAGTVAGAGAVSVLAAGGLAATIGVLKVAGYVAKPFIWAGKKTINLFRSKKKDGYKKFDDEEKLDRTQDINPPSHEEEKRKREKSKPENSVTLNLDQINISQPLSPRVSEKYRQEGNKFFDKENPTKELFEYADDKVLIKSISHELVNDILKDLKDRGETTATISGSPEFMAIAVEEANKLGIKLKGQTVAASKEIEALQTYQLQMQPRSPTQEPPPQSPTPPSGPNGELRPETHWLDAYTPKGTGEELEIKHQDATHTFLGKPNASQWKKEYVAQTADLDPALRSAGKGTKVNIVKNSLGVNTMQLAVNQQANDASKALNQGGAKR
jgi:hypothetical protein